MFLREWSQKCLVIKDFLITFWKALWPFQTLCCHSWRNRIETCCKLHKRNGTDTTDQTVNCWTVSFIETGQQSSFNESFQPVFSLANDILLSFVRLSPSKQHLQKSFELSEIGSKMIGTITVLIRFVLQSNFQPFILWTGTLFGLKSLIPKPNKNIELLIITKGVKWPIMRGA